MRVVFVHHDTQPSLAALHGAGVLTGFRSRVRRSTGRFRREFARVESTALGMSARARTSSVGSSASVLSSTCCSLRMGFVVLTIGTTLLGTAWLIGPSVSATGSSAYLFAWTGDRTSSASAFIAGLFIRRVAGRAFFDSPGLRHNRRRSWLLSYFSRSASPVSRFEQLQIVTAQESVRMPPLVDRSAR